MERLEKDEILSSLYFFDFTTCVDCIKEKYTKIKKKDATRAVGLLEIIHMDICSTSIMVSS